MIFGSSQNPAMLPGNLPQIIISGSPILYVEQVINLVLLMTLTLNWQLQIAAITNKIYVSLSSLDFHLKSSNAPQHNFASNSPKTAFRLAFDCSLPTNKTCSTNVLYTIQ